MGPAHQHRRHQRQHLATRIRSSRAITQTVQSRPATVPGHPNRDIKVPATNNPASATNDPSSNTTPNRSTSLLGILFTRSASSAWVTAVIAYSYFPRSERHFTALTPHTPTNHRWIQAKSSPTHFHCVGARCCAALIRQVRAAGYLERLSVAGSSRTPFCLACRTRTIWQYWSVPSLSGLLSTLAPVPGFRLPSASTCPLRRARGGVLSPPHGQKTPRGAPDPPPIGDRAPKR